MNKTESKEVEETRLMKEHRERLSKVLDHISSYVPPGIEFVIGITDKDGGASYVQIKASGLNGAKLVFHLKDALQRKVEKQGISWAMP